MESENPQEEKEAQNHLYEVFILTYAHYFFALELPVSGVSGEDGREGERGT